MSRSGLRHTDVNRLAALIRGGESWEQACTIVPDVDPVVIERFKDSILALAAEAGPVLRLVDPDVAAIERQQLDAWLSAGKPFPKPAVYRSINRSR